MFIIFHLYIELCSFTLSLKWIPRKKIAGLKTACWHFWLLLSSCPRGRGAGCRKKTNFTPTEQCKVMTTNNSSSEMIRNGKHEKKVFKKQRSVLFFQINWYYLQTFYIRVYNFSWYITLKNVKDINALKILFCSLLGQRVATLCDLDDLVHNQGLNPGHSRVES